PPALCRFPTRRPSDLIPEAGGAILASNHLAVVDSFFLPARIRRRVYFLAKKEYFTEKGLKGRFKRWFMLSTGQHPVDRSGGSAKIGRATSELQSRENL